MSEKRRALISVSDKQGVVEFARGLIELGFEIVSTGGTMAALVDAGVEVRAVSDVTGVPSILGGRVKTLHPAIFGGILAQRHLSEDLRTLREHGIAQIDVVAVNLYPFQQTVARDGTTDPEIIDQIDIGGVALLRAAAKNHHDLYAVAHPSDYPEVLRVLAEGREADSMALRRRLAAKVYEHCSAYDRAIGEYLLDGGPRDEDAGGARSPAREDSAPSTQDPSAEVPEAIDIAWPLTHRLRYGENPHQAAAFYADPKRPPSSLAQCRQLQGKELSYNNYLDADAALEMARQFDETVAVIVKHANPCGVGRGNTSKEAYERALKGDPVSAFGGIVGFSRPVDAEAAEAMSSLFLEVVIAPKFDDEALKVLSKKKNLRLLEAGELSPPERGLACRSVSGGLLAQTTDVGVQSRDSMTVASKAKPTGEDWEALIFAWRIVRFVRSNAIVYATAQRTLGVGAGQMSRIDAARFGLQKAGNSVRDAYVASDGFLPFRDVVDFLAEAGIRALIQPGGSIRDEESIAAADEHGLIMVLTGQRHFRH